MNKEAIMIAKDYMEQIAPEFQSSILKILWAYKEKSKQLGGGN